jgi:hypothetical protein
MDLPRVHYVPNIHIKTFDCERSRPLPPWSLYALQSPLVQHSLREPTG